MPRRLLSLAGASLAGLVVLIVFGAAPLVGPTAAPVQEATPSVLSVREKAAELVQAARARATAVPLGTRPALRDFDSQSPPFAPAATQEPEPPTPAGRLTILLLGIDQRPDEAASGGDPGRTDSMLLLSVDYDAGTVALASIPRDGFVNIPGYGNHRINAAYTFGELERRGNGPLLAKKTISELFGVRIDRFVLVDVKGVVRLVDSLGGVWVHNPRRLVDHAYPTEDYGYKTLDIPAGWQLMDGERAVEYARTRHPDSDYGRQQRQQQVLLAIRDRTLQLEMLPRLPQVLPRLLDAVDTDLTPVEVLQLAAFGRNLDQQRDIVRLEPDPVLTPPYTGYGGASYVELTPVYTGSVKLLLTRPRVAAERARVEVLSAGAAAGAGTQVGSALESMGLSVAAVSTLSNVSPGTRIEAGASARRSAELIARVLGVPGNAIQIAKESETQGAVEPVASPTVRVVLGRNFDQRRAHALEPLAGLP